MMGPTLFQLVIMRYHMLMKTIDWSSIYKKYKGKWVALAEDEKTVLSFGTSAKVIIKKSHDAGYKNPIITKMPQKLITCVGAGL
jgi:hypothetical protein